MPGSAHQRRSMSEGETSPQDRLRRFCCVPRDQLAPYVQSGLIGELFRRGRNPGCLHRTVERRCCGAANRGTIFMRAGDTRPRLKCDIPKSEVLGCPRGLRQRADALHIVAAQTYSGCSDAALCPVRAARACDAPLSLCTRLSSARTVGAKLSRSLRPSTRNTSTTASRCLYGTSALSV